MSRHPRRRLRIIPVLATLTAPGFMAAGAGPPVAVPAARPAHSPAGRRISLLNVANGV